MRGIAASQKDVSLLPKDPKGDFSLDTEFLFHIHHELNNVQAHMLAPNDLVTGSAHLVRVERNGTDQGDS